MSTDRRAAALEALAQQTIELPSWAFGNSGTRFKVFGQPGVARDPFEKLEDAVQLPAYSDRKVEAGKTYRYQISAIDQSGNESARSQPVTVTIPQ